MKAWRPSSTQRDIRIQHTRDIILRIVFDLQMKFPRFHQPFDKASCDAFLLYSALSDTSCSHQSYYRTDALQSYEIILINHKIEAKYSKTLLKKCFHPKMWYDFQEIRNLYKIQLLRRLLETKHVERRKTTC